MTDSPIPRDSHEWPKLKRWMLGKIVEYQRELEDCSGTVHADVHNIMRGRIAAFRELLATVEPEQRLEANDVVPPALDTTLDY